jgi:hypothetical protein
MSQATGWSSNFDFGEALKDAAGKLPSGDTNGEAGFTVSVTRIEGNFTRGIVPPHLEVTVQTGTYDQQSTGRGHEMTNGTNAATRPGQPNEFTLRGENKEITFLTTSFPGEPVLTYRDENGESSTFRGDEVDINETQISKLVTVLIEQVPDSHVVFLSLLLPTIYLPEGAREFPIETTAIITTRQTPFTGPGGTGNGLQVETYEPITLKGAARLIIT